jgi:hypothetical protein
VRPRSKRIRRTRGPTITLRSAIAFSSGLPIRPEKYYPAAQKNLQDLQIYF